MLTNPKISLFNKLFISIIFFFYNVVYSQPILEKEIELKIIDKPLSFIVDSISRKYDVKFSYNSGLSVFENYKSIDQKATLLSVLKELLYLEPLDFEVINNLVVIYVKKDTQLLVENKSKAARISGRVLDFDTGEPLPYASVCLMDARQGVVTNENGYFQIQSESYINDTLSVSYVGFHKYHFLVTTLLDTTIDIQLLKAPISIAPVVINYFHPNEIIKKVIENIENNYTIHPLQVIAFFRETTLQNGRYQYVCEALLDIYKSAYNNEYRSDRATIIKGRRILFIKEESRIKYKLEGGIYNTMLIDIIKERANFLMSENFDKYEYRIEKFIHEPDRDIIVVSFDQRVNVDQPLFSGLLYIDKSNYSIVTAEFGISKRGMMLASSILVKKQSRSLKVKPLKTNYRVCYAKHNNKYLLDNITGEVEIEVREKLFSTKKIFRSITELVVNQIDSTNVVVPKRSQIISVNQVLSENLDDFEPGFWGESNIIVPGQTLQDAVSQFRYKQLIEKAKNALR